MGQTRDRSCPTGKARFTAAEAQAWLAEYRRTKPPRAPRMRAYDDCSCGGVHVTSRRSWIPSGKRAKRKGVTW